MKKKKFYGLCAAVLLSAALVGCSGDQRSDTRTEQATVAQDSKQTGFGDTDMEVAEVAEDGIALENTENGTESEAGDTDAKLSESEREQKLIRTVILRAETKKFDTLQQTLKQKIEACNGYIESSQLNGNREDEGSRSANYTIRIPEKQADDFLKAAEENAHILYREENTTDVTLDYVDTKSRIESLRIEQESLLKLLEKATKLSDIYSIQSELTDVRYQIESYESQLRTMENQVNYVTIDLSISEVEKETPVTEPTYWEEVKERFQGALDDTVHMLRSFSLWLISAIPSILFLAIVIFIGRLIWKKIRKHRKKRPARQPQYPNPSYHPAASNMPQNTNGNPVVPNMPQNRNVDSSDIQESGENGTRIL
ncbi:MAG: DUF4349 domain-containing protein [Lachnospiraceae bacterium]